MSEGVFMLNSQTSIKGISADMFRRLIKNKRDFTSLKKTGSFLCLSFLALAVSASQAQAAEWVFSPAFSYRTEKIKDTTGGVVTTSTDTSNFTADLRLLYAVSGAVYFGGMYKIIKNTSFSTDTTGTAAGPTLGFSTGGFSMFATYHLMGDYKTTTTSYSEGKGLQLDFSYHVMVGGNFGLGPQISYRDVQYAKNTTGGVTSSDSHEVSTWDPYIAIFFVF